MRHNNFLLAIFIFIFCFPVFGQEIAVIYPDYLDSNGRYRDPNDKNRHWVQLDSAAAIDTTLYFRFPNYTRDVKYSGLGRILIETLSGLPASGDDDSLGISARELFYDIRTETLKPIQRVGVDSTLITDIDYDWGTGWEANTIRIKENVDFNLCNAVAVDIRRGSGAPVWLKIWILIIKQN